MGSVVSSQSQVEVRHAEDEVLDVDERDLENINEEDIEEEDIEEEDEEAWRRRREGYSADSYFDFLKKILAIAFFSGLGIIVIIAAATATPLLTPNPEDLVNSMS